MCLENRTQCAIEPPYGVPTRKLQPRGQVFSFYSFKALLIEMAHQGHCPSRHTFLSSLHCGGVQRVPNHAATETVVMQMANAIGIGRRNAGSNRLPTIERATSKKDACVAARTNGKEVPCNRFNARSSRATPEEAKAAETRCQLTARIRQLMSSSPKARVGKSRSRVSGDISARCEEAAYIELKLRLAESLRERRRHRRLTQVDLARLVKSSQSRVAKMEAGDPSVSIDLLIRSLLALRTSNREISRIISSSHLASAT